nr:RNase adapter RapZ [Enterobacter roggenkampii]
MQTTGVAVAADKSITVCIEEQLADYFRSRGKNVQSRHRTLEKRKT